MNRPTRVLAETAAKAGGEQPHACGLLPSQELPHSHLYEPELNATYQEMAAHYGCAIIPARK